MRTEDLIKKELAKYQAEKPFIGKNAILDKKTFYELASDGLCGNTMRTWMSYEAWTHNNNPTDRYYGIRSLFKDKSKCLPKVIGLGILETLCDYALAEGTYVITEIPPAQPAVDYNNFDLSFIQGELTWFNGQYYLYYSHVPGYMRESLAKHGKNISGHRSLLVLKKVLNEAQYNDLLNLLETYHDVTYGYPVIEFALTKKPCGRLNQNLIIWEVRHY